ncbi:Hypothetical protein IALB_2437 [Ignavibacterium album JCM 16511]|uniref:Uncharacterized protein n=1 Tax=Ignavibacterium album (strain DSM 19864 / JCM 16511 / NBRC 101810 / Mat9-16) TaxID=945713 RepID=I0AMD3_IGNAJ|nr:hypothetical protein [Ignavibacterium album]AFH50140.1 Hypothetical protein IALB_2437 [Ignavibacterium album JCM 16511]
MTTKNFKNEIKLLDQIYEDMIEATHSEPDLNDIESMRLFIENSFRIFNRTIFRIVEVKNALSENEKPDSSTWNPPA